MAFSRVKPGNWALNEKLTSAQQNLLDADHANAIDKTGDTVPGTIGIDGHLEINNGGAFAALGGSSVSMGAGSNVQLSPGPGGQLVVGNNTTMLVAAGSNLTVNGSTQLASAQTAVLSTVSLIAISPAITRTRVCRSYCSGTTSPGGGGTPSLFFTTSDIAGDGAWLVQQLNGGKPFVLFPIDAPHGSTITAIQQWVKPYTGHGPMPANKPRLALVRKDVVTPASMWDPPTEVLGVTAPQTLIGDYELKTLELYLPGIAEVIDRSQYVYYLRLTGEHGANSVAGMYASMPRYTITVNKYEDF